MIFWLKVFIKIGTYVILLGYILALLSCLEFLPCIFFMVTDALISPRKLILKWREYSFTMVTLERIHPSFNWKDKTSLIWFYTLLILDFDFDIFIGIRWFYFPDRALAKIYIPFIKWKAKRRVDCFWNIPSAFFQSISRKHGWKEKLP